MVQKISMVMIQGKSYLCRYFFVIWLTVLVIIIFVIVISSLIPVTRMAMDNCTVFKPGM